mgnify:FL=1
MSSFNEEVVGLLREQLMKLDMINEALGNLTNAVASSGRGVKPKIQMPKPTFDLKTMNWNPEEGARGYFEWTDNADLVAYVKVAVEQGAKGWFNEDDKLWYWLYTNGDRVGRKEAKWSGKK